MAELPPLVFAVQGSIEDYDRMVTSLLEEERPVGLMMADIKAALAKRWLVASPPPATPVYPHVNGIVEIVCYCGTKHHQAKCPCCGRAMGWEEAEAMALAAKVVTDQMKFTIGGADVPASWGRPMRYAGVETSRVSASAPNKSSVPRAAFDDFDAPLRALNWRGGF